jgi:hypothetical protein
MDGLSGHGVDVAFNLDNDPNITKETINILSTRGAFVKSAEVTVFPANSAWTKLYIN